MNEQHTHEERTTVTTEPTPPPDDRERIDAIRAARHALSPGNPIEAIRLERQKRRGNHTIPKETR